MRAALSASFPRLSTWSSEPYTTRVPRSLAERSLAVYAPSSTRPASAPSSAWSAAYCAAMEPPSECPPTHHSLTWGNASRTSSAALMPKNAKLKGISTAMAR